MRNIIEKLSGFGFDTSLVLLFLALEIGRSGAFASVETLLMSVTMLMLLVLPYFLPAGNFEPPIALWLVFRGAVMVFGIVCGLVLPESMRFLPMNLVILTGICSCVARFYGLMKLRLAD